MALNPAKVTLAQGLYDDLTSAYAIAESVIATTRMVQVWRLSNHFFDEPLPVCVGTFSMVILDNFIGHNASSRIGSRAAWGGYRHRFFLATLALDIILSLFAIGRTHHRGLWRYTPTMWLSFHIATIAAFKALYESISKPFFLDKTSHRHSFSKLVS